MTYTVSSGALNSTPTPTFKIYWHFEIREFDEILKFVKFALSICVRVDPLRVDRRRCPLAAALWRRQQMWIERRLAAVDETDTGPLRRSVAGYCAAGVINNAG